ncbi:hypothetical protein EYB53_014210 [Candidatus Chloroploca sp. M-50]|uniref:Uncharacterized protein n=1 Tax=Candidatus Chloroploca mongolica TaxID=2528176 RepID=A0ABS4DBP1_9CHLR|nr:hypothetical protein [Candidatus Chloroploca mongolica]MBP1466864.1 hypothetical protein [Candidatus Chloroploca mongolica]
MTWFEALTGVRESSPDEVRTYLRVEGTQLHSTANGASFVCGQLAIPSLGELRREVAACTSVDGRLTVREVVANVQHLHADPANTSALFQVASQFNLLEMTSPNVTPEQGVGIYDYDHTQGPACAIAAGAGTIYRNYFAPVNGRIGQTASNQIDCLADLGHALGNANGKLWQMQNGYALPSRSGLTAIGERLQAASEAERDDLRSLLRIGMQWQTQVTIAASGHLVSQAYCSALPVAYASHPTDLWEPFARMVLEAAYEATLCAGIINAATHGSPRIFLTLLGGGVFGNDIRWIIASIARALHRYQAYGLDVAIVSHGRSNDYVRQLIAD